VGLEPLLLFMPLFYFISLLFKHFGIILENIRRDGKKHSDIEEKQKNFFSVYILLT